MRAKQLLDEAGLEAHEVRPGVLVPVLEGATLADEDESLQERWAALLANAAANPPPPPPPAIPPSFPYVLGQLSPTDAKLLDVCFAWPQATAPFEARGYVKSALEVHAREAARAEGIEGREFELALDNLIRLRLVLSHATYGDLVAETVMLTTLGYELVRACEPPGRDAE